jgi:hypothetical protein
LKNRQIAWLSTIENPTDVSACLPIGFGDARAVTNQATVDCVLAKVINGWKFIFCGKLDNPASSGVEVRGTDHEQCTDTMLEKRLQASFQISVISRSEHIEP